MISEKMKKLAENNSVIRAMFEEGQQMAREFGAENVYDFSLGNPDLDQPEEVAEAVAFFANPNNAYITGQVLCVDGGMAV